MDPWRQIETRPRPDAGGKQVDIHVRPKTGRAFIYRAQASLGRERLLAEVLNRLRRIRDSPTKRIRERRFNVWYGTATPMDAEPLEVIMIPDRFDFATWELLEDLGQLPSYLESGSFPVADIDGGPLARYDHGEITAYVAPTVVADQGAGEDVLLRSSTVAEPKRRPPTKWILPPKGRSPRWHTIQVWEENHERILDFTWHIRAAGTYARLAAIAEEHLGISVCEGLDASDPRYGLLRIGFLRPDVSAVPVAVFLRADLPDRLKYIVLAHELSHYAFHFPLLYLGAIVDDMSRVVPEAAPVFDAVVTQHLDRDALEAQADRYASLFLIPPQYDLNGFADIYSEVGRGGPTADELAWRFLQPLIPGAVDEAITWSNVHQMSQLAAADIDAIDETPASVYARMLKATIDRINGREHDPDQRISQGMGAIQEAFDEIVATVLNTSVDEARASFRDRMGPPDPTSVPDDMQPERFDLVAPAVLPAGTLPRALHLVPAPSNPQGRTTGLWLDRHHDRDPPMSVEGWSELLEDDVAIRLYRHEAWQPPLGT